MWKQSGRSSALERAQAVLSSRRGRAAPAATAHLAPRMSQGGAVHAPPARMSSELLSDLSDSESSLSPGLGQDHRPGATVPNHTSDWVPEESNGRLQLHTEAPPVLHPPLTSPRNTWLVQPQANPSPGSMSPSPACLSPSAPSLPPSPPCLSSVGSACEALEELLPLEAASDAHSDRSDSSGCFRLNLMNLDELALAALLLEEHPNAQEPELQEVHEEEVETVHEEEVETVHEEEVETVHEEEVETVHVEEVSEEEVEEVHEEDYPSDFESVIQTEGISEHSQDSGQPPSPRSQSNYSNMFTRATPSDPCTLEPPPHSHAPLPKPDTTSVGLASRLPAVCNPCPSLGLLMQSLRQQLALTSHFISSAQEQRTRLLEGLGPPSYRYTTLQDTLQYISILGASRSHSDQQTARR